MVGAHAGPRPCVLLAAGRAEWEPEVLGGLAAAGMVVLRRCVDLADLLAATSSGRADVAVVAGGLPGLDADAVRRLRQDDVRILAVATTGDSAQLERLARLGISAVTEPAHVADAVESLLATAAPAAAPEPTAMPGSRGRVVTVWGATGAPGRTTVAVGLAAEHAAAGRATVLVDADPYGGAVAQHLGVLDEVSGLLACARLVNEGALVVSSFAHCRRRVAECLDVVTGLPRPDRWIEVRPGVVDEVLALAAEQADVVVDCGFSVETDGLAGPGAMGRNTTTLGLS
ncbi:hypothetical protein [Nocardioides terrisoli]|uniref:hypothetical protein n=1 Tax=Nocardioides terrisoli TaxID=3388267 RepID=UPI00287BAA6E|nr:hypothetical protein [Nocardioides marmorisolisilvae]